MSRDRADEAAEQGGGRGPYRVRLPGFLVDDDLGLGAAVKRATSAFGIRPCGGCEQRAAALDRWVVFTGGRPDH